MNHHPFSPSKLYRLFLCPGSHRMSENMPEFKSEAAKEGTRLHGLVSDYLFGCDIGFDLLEEDFELIKKCFNFQQKFVPFPDSVKDHVFFEMPVILKRGDEIITEGIADLVVLNPPMATIIDWKFGWNPPNRTALVCQGYAYAASLMNMRPEIELVDVWFYNPRLDLKFHANVQVTDLPGIVSRIELIKKHAQSDEWWKHLNPSPVACEYCPGASCCPALRTTVMSKPFQACDLVSSYDLAQVLEKKPMIEKFLEAATDAARTILANGGSIKGNGFEYVLQERSGQRKITDPQAVFQALSEQGVTIEQFMQAVKVSVNSLEKAVKPIKLDILGDLIQRGGSYTVMIRKELNDSGN